MARQRLSDWLAAPGAAPTSKPAGGYDDFRSLLWALRSGTPGQWSQNLVELARHFTSAVYLAVNTLATQASGSDFHAFERTDDPSVATGQTRLPYFDPLHELFEVPNPEDSFSDLLYQTVQQQSLTGVSLLWTVPNDRGDEPAELYNIPSSTAWPMPPSPAYPRGAYRVLPYPYGLLGSPVGQISAGAIIPSEQIVKIKNHHPFLKYDGYAPLTAMGLHVDTLEGIDKARFSAQQLGCEQTHALELDGDLQDLDEPGMKRLRAQMQALYGGPTNTGRLFVTPKGASLKKMSTTPAEMGWTEGWIQLLDFVLAGYGVPGAVAGLQQSLSYATLYASLRAFHLLTLTPLLNRIAQGWTRKLIWPTYGMAFGLKIVAPEFKDESLLEQQLNTDLRCGARLIKEIRELRGLNPINAPWTNERAMAFTQLTPMEGHEPGPKKPGQQEEDPDVNNARPNNRPKSNGFAKPRGILLAAMERAKTNGHALPVKE